MAKKKAPWGRYRDMIQINGDIISPIDIEPEPEPVDWFGRDRDIIIMHDDLIDPVDVEWEAETGENWDLP